MLEAIEFLAMLCVFLFFAGIFCGIKDSIRGEGS